VEAKAQAAFGASGLAFEESIRVGLTDEGRREVRKTLP
jgi:hypothetical protein